MQGLKVSEKDSLQYYQHTLIYFVLVILFAGWLMRQVKLAREDKKTEVTVTSMME